MEPGANTTNQPDRDNNSNYLRLLFVLMKGKENNDNLEDHFSNEMFYLELNSKQIQPRTLLVCHT